jgi:hypothetical protein
MGAGAYLFYQTDILYLFMKIVLLISKLRKSNGSGFNPGELSEFAALAFNDGSNV